MTMGRKEYSQVELAVDQFLFEAARDEFATSHGQHRAERDWLLGRLNNDLGAAPGTAIVIPPASVFDAHVSNVGSGERLAPT